MVTWIIGGLLFAAVVAIIWKMVSDRRQGKSGCGFDCANCHGVCSNQPK